MRLSIVLGCALLVACGSQDDSYAEVPANDDPAMAEVSTSAPAPTAGPDDIVTSSDRAIPALDSAGLRMVIPSGATRLLAFGTPRRSVENALARALGRAGTRSSNAECGAGPMEFSRLDGLTLNFQDDAFVGWTLQPPSPLGTIDGIALGATRAEIEETRTISMVEGSTLGAEFATGGIGGFFDGEGDTVNLLYAGTQCFAR